MRLAVEAASTATQAMRLALETAGRWPLIATGLCTISSSASCTVCEPNAEKRQSLNCIKNASIILKSIGSRPQECRWQAECRSYYHHSVERYILYLFHMSSISGLKFSYESRIKKMLPTIIKTPVFSNDGTGQSERAVRSGPANGVDSERTHAHA